MQCCLSQPVMAVAPLGQKTWHNCFDHHVHHHIINISFIITISIIMIKLPSSSSPSSSSHPSGGSSSGGAPKYEIHLCITFLFISPFISLHLESIIWSPSSSLLPPSSLPSQSTILSSLHYFAFYYPFISPLHLENIITISSTSMMCWWWWWADDDDYGDGYGGGDYVILMMVGKS